MTLHLTPLTDFRDLTLEDLTTEAATLLASVETGGKVPALPYGGFALEGVTVSCRGPETRVAIETEKADVAVLLDDVQVYALAQVLIRHIGRLAAFDRQRSLANAARRAGVAA